MGGLGGGWGVRSKLGHRVNTLEVLSENPAACLLSLSWQPTCMGRRPSGTAWARALPLPQRLLVLRVRLLSPTPTLKGVLALSQQFHP